MKRFSTTRVALAAVFGAALVLATAPAALAHAAYKDSTPGDGETVSSPPSQITAEFTEPITDSSYLQVFDPCGERVDGDDSQISGYNMSVSMSADVAGRYVVEFAAQSVDTHVTYGSFSFTSTGGAACAGEEPPDPEPGGGGGSGGGSGGSGGGGGGSTGGGGGASTGDPGSGGAGSGPASGSGSGSGAAGATSDRKGGSARHSDHGKRDKPGGGRGDGPSAAAPDDSVPFENTGAQGPAPTPAAWDLPIGGVVMALALCVMIGAAGGRVYAGIVAPPRR